MNELHQRISFNLHCILFWHIYRLYVSESCRSIFFTVYRCILCFAFIIITIRVILYMKRSADLIFLLEDLSHIVIHCSNCCPFSSLRQYSTSIAAATEENDLSVICSLRRDSHLQSAAARSNETIMQIAGGSTDGSYVAHICGDTAICILKSCNLPV